MARQTLRALAARLIEDAKAYAEAEIAVLKAAVASWTRPLKIAVPLLIVALLLAQAALTVLAAALGMALAIWLGAAGGLAVAALIVLAVAGGLAAVALSAVKGAGK